MLRCEMIPAGRGDCLWIEYGSPQDVHRVLIDGGPEGTYDRLRERIVALPAHQRRFDLVVCKGVLQYLTRDEAERALDNLGELCRGCLYLEALTTEDWTNACDKRRTDGEVYLRPVRFYRSRLRRSFRGVGAGVFVHERSPAVLYALETS